MTLTLAEKGANVVVCSNPIEAYEKVVKKSEALKRQVPVLALEVTDSESVVQGVEKAISHFSTG